MRKQFSEAYQLLEAVYWRQHDPDWWFPDFTIPKYFKIGFDGIIFCLQWALEHKRWTLSIHGSFLPTEVKKSLRMFLFFRAHRIAQVFICRSLPCIGRDTFSHVIKVKTKPRAKRKHEEDLFESRNMIIKKAHSELFRSFYAFLRKSLLIAKLTSNHWKVFINNRLIMSQNVYRVNNFCLPTISFPFIIEAKVSFRLTCVLKLHNFSVFHEQAKYFLHYFVEFLKETCKIQSENTKFENLKC